MGTVLVNTTTAIILAGVDYDLSFNETLNDTSYGDAFDADDGGGHHDYGERSLFDMIVMYFKLVIDVAGLLGNVVVVLLVTFCHDLHSAANYHFLNMAVADFILLLENLAARINNIVHFDLFRTWDCLPLYLHTVVVQTSSLTLAALSIDRFKLIVRPLKNLHDRSTAKVFISLIAVWFVSFALHIPSQLFSVQNGSYCKVILPWVHGKLVYGIYSNVALFYLPTSIVLYCNLSIIAKIRRRRPGVSYLDRNAQPTTSHDTTEDGHGGTSAAITTSKPVVTRSPKDAKSSRRARSSRIIVTVVIAYIALNLPFYAFYTLSLIPGAIPWKVYYDGHSYLGLMLLLNSAINPFIYSLMGSNYRKHIRQALRCLCCYGKLCASPPPSENPQGSGKCDRNDTQSSITEQSQ
eukprot:XP_001186640.1 PREDICTED: octopamine receptor beta-2R [Strongylocentrotus purpuratus]